MSSYNISNLPRISREDLAALIHNKPESVQVIDVRDNDFIGGHITNCRNHPVNTHDYAMPELVRTLKGKENVVFHCSLSQQRGPSSALRYLRERERVEGQSEGGGGGEGQKVWLLDGGFVKWVEKYGEDKALTEGYQKDIWEFGY
ncbi:hypothetical protein MBLNU230_g4250t2 [Neophaeotheca triangularis]